MAVVGEGSPELEDRWLGSLLGNRPERERERERERARERERERERDQFK